MLNPTLMNGGILKVEVFFEGYITLEDVVVLEGRATYIKPERCDFVTVDRIFFKILG